MATTRTRFDLSRLAATAPAVGRADEIEALTADWLAPAKKLLWIRADAGAGKSTLVNAWLASLREAGFRGADRVFGWTFHGQGAGPAHASVDAFLDYALRWLGDDRPAAGSPWERGHRLGRLVQGQRTLLVLDGMEDHQGEPDEAGDALLRDPALAALLRSLERHNPGLCVITSRKGLKKPSALGDEASREKGRGKGKKSGTDLTLDEATAGELFEGLPVTRDQVQTAVRKLKGHPFALAVLAAHLRKVSDGGTAIDMAALGPASARVSDPVAHVLEAHRSALGSHSDHGARLSLLRLAGIFEGPADREALRAVRGTEPIEDLTEGLGPEVPDSAIDLAAADLRHAGLLSSGSGSPGCLDAPRSLRGFFNKNVPAAAAKEASNRLFEHFCSNGPEIPREIDDLLCLHAAVTYGCRSGCAQDAYTRVYRRRIAPDGRFWSTFRLGAFDAEVSVLSAFFEKPWTELREDLTDPESRLSVLMAAGVNLRSLGRLEEAEQAFGAALAMAGPETSDAPARNPGRAADAASSLSEVALARGRIEEAIAHARTAVTHADASGDLLRRGSKRAYLADALHQAGRFGEAEETFQAAEAIQESWQPGFPLLYSLRGYQYHDFLLREPEALLLGVGRRPSEAERKRAEVQAQEILDRVKRLFSWRRDSDSDLDVGLEHLARGRARLARDLAKDEAPSDAARSHLDQAVRLLRDYAALYRLPCGLLARAAYRRLTDDFEGAAADLDEALGIAEHGEMVLLQADVHLEQARLEQARRDLPAARRELGEAERLMDGRGYHRRDRELADLAAVLGTSP